MKAKWKLTRWQHTKKNTQTTLLIMCNANETRQGERAQHQWFPHQVSKHCAQPPNWNCNWRLPLSAATAHTATGSTKGNNELRANNAHKVDPNGNSCCCCCAILIPWLPFDSASNNNKREPPLLLSRVATRSLSLSVSLLSSCTHSLCASVPTFGSASLGRCLSRNKIKKKTSGIWSLLNVKEI